MIAAFAASSIGRWLAAGVVVLCIAVAIYARGRSDAAVAALADAAESEQQLRREGDEAAASAARDGAADRLRGHRF